MNPQRFDEGNYARKDELLGYRMIENARIGEYSLNNLGFRGQDLAVDKPAGTVRVICVGGSTTIGSNAGGDAYSYPAILEAILKRTFAGASGIEVINAGVFGYHSWHTVIRVLSEFERYDPDVYVFMDGLNDVAMAHALDDCALKELGGGQVSRALAGLLGAERGNVVQTAREFLRGLALYSIMEDAYASLQAKGVSRDSSKDMTRKMELFGYASNMEKALAAVSRRDKTAVLVNYPWSVDGRQSMDETAARLPQPIEPWVIALYAFGRDYISGANADLADRLGVAYVDPQSEFDSLADRWGLARLYSDNIHFTRYGNYQVAKAVCRKLSELDAFKKLAGPPVELDLDAAFPELASWIPVAAAASCLGMDMVSASGICPSGEKVDVSGLDAPEADTMGSWRWAHGGRVVLSFESSTVRPMRLDFAFSNPVPGQSLAVVANGSRLCGMEDLPAQRWLTQKTEGACEFMAKKGANHLELVFALGNRRGYEFAPGDGRDLNAAFLRLEVTPK